MLGAIFPFIGAWAGSAFGTLGTWLGWGIGLAVGNKLDPQYAKAPRLDDLSVPTAGYGDSLPMLWGEDKIAERRIWSIDLIECVDTIEGGLFGWFDVGEVVYYRGTWASAFVDCRITGQVEAFNKIWFGSKLYYNNAPDATPREKADAAAKVARGEVVFYYGTATQGVDPTMEAVEGVGNVPKYKYTGYILFNNVNLKKYGNTAPGVYADILMSAKVSPAEWLFMNPGTPSLPWGARSGAGAVVFNDKLFIIMGLNNAGNLDDVYSTSDGSNWSSEIPFPGQARDSFTPIEITFYNPITFETYPVIVVFGGYGGGSILSDCWHFNGSIWEQWSITGDSILPRDSYAAVYNPDDGFIYAYGGEDGNGGLDSTGHNRDLWRTADGIGWHKLISNTTADQYYASGAHTRAGASFLYFENYLWLIGGTSHNVSALDCPITSINPSLNVFYIEYDQTSDIHSYVYVTGSYGGINDGYWEVISASYGAGYTAIFVTGNVQATGGALGTLTTGHEPGGVGFSNGVYRYDPSTNVFTEMTPNLTNTGITPTKIPTSSGDVWGAVVWSNKLVAFVHGEGGKTETFSSEDGETWVPWAITRGEHSITTVDTGADTFTINGDQTDYVSTDDHFYVYESTGNNGRYTVSNVSYDSGTKKTTITVQEEINDSSLGTLVLVAEMDDFASGAGYPAVIDFLEDCYVMGGERGGIANNEIYKVEKQTAAGEAVSHATIVRDLCLESGLTEEQIDVSEIEEIEDKSFIKRNRSANRNSIEQLMRAGLYDAVSSDGKIKFPARGGDSVVTIPETVLGAVSAGDEYPDKVPINRQNDFELPSLVNVNYIDPARNFGSGTQSYRRIGVTANLEKTVQFDISMTADRARTLAFILLWEAWNSRQQIPFSIPYTYLYLDPTDVITLEKDGDSYKVRLERIDYIDGVLQCESALEDSSLYTRSIEGIESGGNVDSVSPIRANTRGFLLDIPNLFPDKYIHYGLHFCANPETEDNEWPGGELWISRDSGTTYKRFGLVPQAAVTGICSTTLGDGLTHRWDRVNSITITLQHGSLSSISEAEVLAGAGRAYVGNLDDQWEIVQFSNVVDNGNGSYTLSNLLRGRLGTEWATGLHGAGETFILLDESIQKVPLEKTDLGVSLKYKFVTRGEDRDSVSPVNFTCNFVCKKPYAPGALEAVPDGFGNWIITWLRRSPLGYAIGEGDTSELGDIRFKIVITANGRTLNIPLRVYGTGDNYRPTLFLNRQNQYYGLGGLASSIDVSIVQQNEILDGYESAGSFSQ